MVNDRSPIVTIGSDLVRRALWFPLVVFVAHLVLAFLFAYERFPPLDGPMHVLGGLAIGFSVWVGLDVFVDAGVLEPVQQALRAVLLFSLTSTAAVFWEFAEFVSDHTIGTRVQWGLRDTLMDMLLGIVGGLVYLAWKSHAVQEADGRDRER